MRPALDCPDVRALAPDVALDLLSGDERAAALEHLGSCASCRLEVEELSSVADSLLALTPAVPPPPGFEAGVLARMEVATPEPRPSAGRRRRWRAPALVAACAALGAGILLAVPRDADDGVRRASFVTADGSDAGEVVLTDGDPDNMMCTIDDPRFTGAYTIGLVLDDGTRREVGAFEVDGDRYTWGTPLPVDADRVRSIEVRSPDGVVRSTAVL